MDLLIGTFNTPTVYTLRFTPRTSPDTAEKLEIAHKTAAVGSHSWLALSPSKAHLYATAWLDPPTVVAYEIQPDHTVTLLNEAPVASRSGYVAASPTHLYSAGGPSGEAFVLKPDGSIGAQVQSLDFTDRSGSGRQASDTSGDSHGGFGGLRHGAHSVDLSPDGRALYVADIGRNCIWTFRVHAGGEGLHLREQCKHVAPRGNDGPRHATPHPSRPVLYSVQEHSGMVDVFTLDEAGVPVQHVQGVRIMPPGEDASQYWADEVRVSASGDGRPHYLYASTRGLEDRTRGYLSVYKLGDDGLLEGDALNMWRTPTSGGIANAVEPAPLPALAALGVADGIEYMALTDSLEGWVFIVRFDGARLEEAARVNLGTGVQAATAVWL